MNCFQFHSDRLWHFEECQPSLWQVDKIEIAESKMPNGLTSYERGTFLLPGDQDASYSVVENVTIESIRLTPSGYQASRLLGSQMRERNFSGIAVDMTGSEPFLETLNQELETQDFISNQEENQTDVIKDNGRKKMILEYTALNMAFILKWEDGYLVKKFGTVNIEISISYSIRITDWVRKVFKSEEDMRRVTLLSQHGWLSLNKLVRFMLK